MRIVEIIWSPAVVDKLAWKHDVEPYEVEEVLFGRSVFRKVQRGHIPGEHVYAGLGQTDAGRYLVVFFIYKTNRKAFVLSARDMDDAERRRL